MDLGPPRFHYLDSRLPHVELAEIRPPAKPAPVQLVFEYFRTPLELDADPRLRTAAVAAMAETGMFTAIRGESTEQAPRLRVTLRRQLDGSGFLSDPSAESSFTWEAVWTSPAKEPVLRSYEHRICETIGHVGRDSEGMRSPRVDDPIGPLIKELVRITLRDLQEDIRNGG